MREEREEMGQAILEWEVGNKKKKKVRRAEDKRQLLRPEIKGLHE